MPFGVNFWLIVAAAVAVLCAIRLIQVRVVGRMNRRAEEDTRVQSVAGKEPIRQAAAYWVGLVRKLIASGDVGPMPEVASRLDALEQCFCEEVARRCLADGYYPRLWHYPNYETCPNHLGADDVFSCALRAAGIRRCPWLLLPATVTMYLSEDRVTAMCSGKPDVTVWTGTTGDTTTFRSSAETRPDEGGRPPWIRKVD